MARFARGASQQTRSETRQLDYTKKPIDRPRYDIDQIMDACAVPQIEQWMGVQHDQTIKNGRLLFKKQATDVEKGRFSHDHCMPPLAPKTDGERCRKVFVIRQTSQWCDMGLSGDRKLVDIVNVRVTVRRFQEKPWFYVLINCETAK